MGESQKHYDKGMKPYITEDILYASIYKKFLEQTEPVVDNNALMVVFGVWIGMGFWGEDNILYLFKGSYYNVYAFVKT